MKCVLILLLVTACCYGETVQVVSPDGKVLTFDSIPGDTAYTIKQHIEATWGYPIEEQTLTLAESTIADEDCIHSFTIRKFRLHLSSLPFSKSGTMFRIYDHTLTSSEKKDIEFIVINLADKPLTKLHKVKPHLQKAGDRIDHIHPLKIFAYMFSNEKLKVGVHNIKKRGGLIWKNFIENMGDSLSEESYKDNLQDHLIEIFAEEVGIDQEIIHQSIRNQHWSEFVSLLITHIPREGDSDRYDM